jgi:hypothetical protein
MNCAICGRPVTSGVVLHTECFERHIWHNTDERKMSDYEKTISDLRNFNANYEANKLTNDAADAIEELQARNDKQTIMIRKQSERTKELLAAVPKWIRVADRLPEQFICVFATDGEDIGIAAFQGFIDDYPVWSNEWNLEYIEDQYDEDFLQVTHWMPLPSTEGLK